MENRKDFFPDETEDDLEFLNLCEDEEDEPMDDGSINCHCDGNCNFCLGCDCGCFGECRFCCFNYRDEENEEEMEE